MHHPVRVLFLCDGNDIRSQMAQGWLQSLGGAAFAVHSAGLETKPLHPLASQVMREAGINISTQRSHHLNDFENLSFDFIITLCDEARNSCLAFPADGETLHWQCEDPAATTGSEVDTLAAYRRTRDALRQHIETWLTAIKKTN